MCVAIAKNSRYGSMTTHRDIKSVVTLTGKVRGPGCRDTTGDIPIVLRTGDSVMQLRATVVSDAWYYLE